MGQGEAKLHHTELAASIHASNSMRASEAIHAQGDHIREVDTFARRAREARSHEVASLSFRVEEMMRQMQTPSHQTQSLSCNKISCSRQRLGSAKPGPQCPARDGESGHSTLRSPQWLFALGPCAAFCAYQW